MHLQKLEFSNKIKILQNDRKDFSTRGNTKALWKKYWEMKKRNRKTQFGSEIAVTTQGQRRFLFCFVFFLLTEKDVNVKISSSTVNFQLYRIKEPKNYFRCRSETNSAAKQHKRNIVICYHTANFWRENTAVVRIFPPFFCLNVNTHVLRKIPCVKLSCLVCCLFLMEFS